MHTFSFIVAVLINIFCYANTLSDLKSDFYVFIDFKFAHNNDFTHVSIEKRIINEFEENAVTIDHAVRFSMNIDKN